MKTQYLRDLYLKPAGSWTRKEIKNWLHPIHGPLPDLLGLVSCNGFNYRVALWAVENSLITVTEVGSKDCPDIEERYLTPKEEECLSRKKGWILSSLCWRGVDEGFTCGNRYIKIFAPHPSTGPREPNMTDEEEDELEKEWCMCVYREIMEETVNIISQTPIGGPLTNG